LLYRLNPRSSAVSKIVKGSYFLPQQKEADGGDFFCPQKKYNRPPLDNFAVALISHKTVKQSVNKKLLLLTITVTIPKVNVLRKHGARLKKRSVHS